MTAGITPGALHRTRLACYLNDHLAGATACEELVRRACGSNLDTPYGEFLERLALEIGEDRQTLVGVMESLDIRQDRLKQAVAWTGEKVGRLKLNGQLLGYSPLSRLIELDVIVLGVTGKRALWRTLRHVAELEPRLGELDFPTLESRADRQLAELEEHRLRAAREGLQSP
jgi:hypothetical protein